MKYFEDSPDTAVFTTVYVTRCGSPILHVYHFEDGYWQFSGKEEGLSDKDFMILRLEEVINMDKSVLEICDIPRGYSASRECVGSKWIVSLAKDE